MNFEIERDDVFLGCHTFKIQTRDFRILEDFQTEEFFEERPNFYLIDMVEIEDDNIWEMGILLKILYTPGVKGFAFFESIPAGLSSVTYEPEATNTFYLDYTLEEFWQHGLTDEYRSHFDFEKVKSIVNKLGLEWKNDLQN